MKALYDENSVYRKQRIDVNAVQHIWKSSGMWRGVILVGSGEVAARLMSFFAFMYLARVLEPATFGILGIASSVVALLVPFAELGYGIPATRSMAENSRRFRTLWNAAVGPKAFAIILAFCVVAITAASIDDRRIQLLLLGNALFIPIGAYSLVWAAYALDAHGAIAWERIVQSGSYLLGVLWFVKVDAHVLYQPIMFVLSAVAGQAILLMLLSQHKDWSLSDNIGDGKAPLWNAGFRLLLGRMPFIHYMHAAVAVSGLVLSLEDVAVVVIASRLFVLGGSFTHVPGSVAFSQLVRDKTGMQSRISSGRSMTMISGLAMSCFLAVALLLPTDVVFLAAGESYVQGATLISWICAALAIQIAHQLLLRVAASEGNEDRIGRSLFLWSLPAYALLPIASFVWGSAGVGISCCIAEGSAIVALSAYSGVKRALSESVRWIAPGAVILIFVIVFQNILDLSSLTSAGLWAVLFIVSVTAVLGLGRETA